MTLKNIKDILAETGYQVAYRMISKQTAPTPPFIVYFETNSNNFKADNKVYKKIQGVQVELYTKTKSETAETNLETILDNHEIAYDKVETYINDEKIYLVTYEIQFVK